MHAWRRQSSHQLDKMSQGQRPEHLFNTPRTVPNTQLRTIIYMELFHRKMQFEIQQMIKLLTACDRRTRAPTQVCAFSVK